MSGSAAIATRGAAALDLFQLALARPDVNRWAFDSSRIRLAYGSRLRRTRALRMRAPSSTTALDCSAALGAQPWVDRATTELRATGLIHAGGAATGQPLTSQEYEIAQLAATGLTNKQIGERMLLSPRTVGVHLYRIFPKLNVASRAGLRDALANSRSKSND